ncbi:uncharacterized protein LOC120478883 [Pimephales promelas]|uniref:uncharacterized protein LOC120478883 n=1 Tax=Pimephales promelas TaxID=90988 RepID=UPI0019556A0E|nr:uncharacterized protein LOC120478883 [Pimephales promelas]
MCANMQLKEDKQKKNRKGEERNLCCAWECSDTDSGINDKSGFHRYRDSKQKVRHKCSYLDEKNFILSPHLFAQPRSCVSGSNASDRANSRWKASQITLVPAKSANLNVNITSERSSAPDASCVPINPSESSDSKTQRQNIASENSMQVHIVEVSRILPMIEWLPETSREQMTVESKGWRCDGFVKASHETRSPEAFRKEASGKKLEWSHRHLAKVAHLGSSLPADGLPTAARHRVVIRRVARVRGYRGTQVQGSHGEQKLQPLPNHKDLYNIYSLSGLQNQYECLCSPFQPRMRHSPVGDLAQNTDRKQKGQRRQFSDAIGDIRYQLGWPKNTESPPYHVTFSHILQVLQSKPGNISEVRGQRSHRAL